jgi:GWxTD domain-containing protein
MKTFQIVLTLLLAAQAAAGQTTIGQDTVGGEGRFEVQFDLARFAGDSTHAFVELYYGFKESSLTYKPDSGGYAGAAVMRYVVRTDSSVVASKEWRVPHILREPSQLSRRQVMTGLESVFLQEGTYTIAISAADLNDPRRRDSLALAVTVRIPPKDHESFSDPELATTIKASEDRSSIFYKNTLEVIPNPSRLFGSGLPVLYYYVELYNLKREGIQGSLTVHTSIIDAAGAEVVSHDKVKQRLNDASVEVGTMNLSTVKGGTYQFRADLLDSSKAILASTSRRFFVFRPGGPADSSVASLGTGYQTSEFAVMNASDLDRQYDYITYLATDIERKQYAALSNVEGKRKFLYEFWLAHDNNGAENSFKKEYFSRIDYADKTFSIGTKVGWKTDRGRVYMIYGPSSEVERYPSSADSNPYEIWHYNDIQGGVIFVFVDTHNLGDFMLVHSTHRNELQDANWYQDYAIKTQ